MADEIFFVSGLMNRHGGHHLVKIAGHGEDTGFEMPCLIIVAKDDMDSFPMAIEETVRVFVIDLFIHIIICITEHAYFHAWNYRRLNFAPFLCRVFEKRKKLQFMRVML